MEMQGIRKMLTKQTTQTYAPYYEGKMSYKLRGNDWNKFVQENYADVVNQTTSENVFRDVVDLYGENLVPTPSELRGMRGVVHQLLSRGEGVAVLTREGVLQWPQRYEMISDGNFTMAAVYTRSLLKGKDYLTFVDTEGGAELWEKDIDDDLSEGDPDDFTFVTEETGHMLYAFSLQAGMGPGLSALQDRINHSIINQNVVLEMNARPFWYLLNYQKPPTNKYMLPGNTPPSNGVESAGDSKAGGRILTTSSQGPFGQLTPPSLGDLIEHHDSLISKVSQSWGIPEHFLKPTGGQVPSGMSLQVLSRRFNNTVARYREALADELLRLAADMQIMGEDGTLVDTAEEMWSSSDDLLQEATDQHGLNLQLMGYPLEYIASVVTPGVDLDTYREEGFRADQPSTTTDSSVLPPADVEE